MKKTALILAFILVLSVFAGCAKQDSDINADSTVKETAADSTDKGDSAQKETAAESSDKGDGAQKETTAEGSDKGDGGQKETSAENSGKDQGSKKEPATDTADKGGNAGSELPSQGYADGVVLEMYIPTICVYFHGEYSEGDDLSGKDLFHLAASFVLNQRSDTAISVPEDKKSVGVTAQQLENTVKLLFGEELILSDYVKYMDEAVGDRYDSDSDTYYFDKSYVSALVGDGYYLSFDDEMDIKEGDTEIRAKVKVCDPEGNKTDLTYTFEKVVMDGYLYARLVKVEK